MQLSIVLNLSPLWVAKTFQTGALISWASLQLQRALEPWVMLRPDVALLYMYTAEFRMCRALPVIQGVQGQCCSVQVLGEDTNKKSMSWAVNTICMS
jgi:hypothetical protein